MNERNIFKFAVKFLLVLLFWTSSGVIVNAGEKSIIIQSTTSTQNSGLFDYILPKFTKATGIVANVVAVGTGQALENGRNGDGDVLLVHAQSDEEKFVADGFGVKRYNVMYNDFIVVGPVNDPANVGKAENAIEALKNIAASKNLFASRGDDSGTNKKEMKLWSGGGIDVKSASGTWYRETGSGMGATLNAAAAMQAYTLTDRATWISFKNKQNLAILHQGDAALFNQYGVIMVSPKRHHHVKAKSAKIFIDWITGPEGQSAIGTYKLDGKQLFFPNAK